MPTQVDDENVFGFIKICNIKIFETKPSYRSKNKYCLDSFEEHCKTLNALLALYNSLLQPHQQVTSLLSNIVISQ